MPTRDSFNEYVPVVVDLDRMISRTVAFRFMGRIHKINPMTQENFLKVVNGLARLDALRTRKDITLDDARKEYANLFTKCIDSISYDDVKMMTEAQISALLKQIIDCVTGTAHADPEKKNSLNGTPLTA